MSWPLVSISEFCETGSGGTPSRKQADFYEGDIPWIKSGDLKEKTVTKATEFITELAIKKSSAKMVPKGAILLAMYGATVGRMAMLGIDATTNQAVCSIVPDENKAFPKYVYYALLNKVPDFLRNAVGGAQPNISQGMIKDTKIPLPYPDNPEKSLKEQKRIAAILDKADGIRRKRQQAIQLADDFLRSVFLDMFGDPVMNPKGWEVKPLGEICKKITDGEHGTVKRLDEGRLYLMARNVNRLGHLDLADVSYVSDEDHQRIYKRCGPEKGDILLVCVGATIGKALIVPEMEEFSLARSVALLKPSEKLTSEYLLALINTKAIQAKFLASGNSSAQAGLYLGKIKETKIPLPSFEKQVEFQKIVNSVRSKIITKYHKSGENSALFNSLSQKAFKGEL